MTAPRPERASAPLAVSALMAALLAALVWTWTTINPAAVEVEHVGEERLPALELIQRAQFADLEASIALRNALLLRDVERTAQELYRYERFQREAALALENLKSRTSGVEGAALLRRVLEARAQMQQVREAAVRLERAAPDQLVPDDVTAGLRPALDHYVQAARRLHEFENEKMQGVVGHILVTTERARVLLAVSGCVAGATLLLLIRQWRAQARTDLARKDAEISRLSEQRNALVREVHHRIKNHLQGLLTLVEAQGTSGRVPPQALAQLQSYVMALVAIHGLQAARADERVPVSELVARQVPLVEGGFPGARVLLQDDASAVAALVPATHAVPLSLAVAELMFNAVKHGRGRAAAVQVSARADACCVAVTNECEGRVAFDWNTAHGFGTGLKLVAGLLEGVASVAQEVQPDRRLRMTLEIPRAAP